MKWLKNHKVTLAMLICSILIGAVGVAFLVTSWENNKQVILALTPIWCFLPLAVIVERVAYKIKHNKEQK